jgi:threonine/homoserine/homoserine lactone efflux protein
MNWTTWSIFATTEFVLCLTPGPAVLFVLSTALRAGTRKSVASILGILGANTGYFVLSATGLGALLLASYRLFFAIKWIGAAYLVFLGIKAITGKAGLLASDADTPVEIRGWRLFGDAFVTQTSNPKAIVFFSALLPQFLNPHSSLVPQVTILAATSALIEFSVLLGYGLAAGRASSFAREPRYANWTNRVAGTILIGAGAGLAALRRN